MNSRASTRNLWLIGSVIAGLLIVATIYGIFAWRPNSSKVVPPVVDGGDSKAVQLSAEQLKEVEAFMSGKAWPEPIWKEASVSTASISPSAATTLKTEDGVVVEVPAGAVDKAQTLTIAKQVVSQKVEQIRYELKLSSGETKLRQPVIVRFPYDPALAPKGLKEVAPRVTHIRTTGKPETLTAAVDATTKTASVTIQDFSWLVPDMLAPKRIWLYRQVRQGIMPDADMIVLNVPYYSQGDYGWCVAAALTMQLQAYGTKTRIWDVARAPIHIVPQIFERDPAWELAPPSLRADPAMGTMKAFTDVKTIYSPHGLEVDQDYFGYWDYEKLNGFLIECITQKRPVVAMLKAHAHAVVVVGYDRDHIYVNDPSGALVDKVGAPSRPGWKLPEGDAFIQRPIPWDKWNEQFSSILNPIGTSWNSIGTQCVVVTKEMAVEPRLISLDVVPENWCWDIQRRRNASLQPPNNEKVCFWWNGTLTKGYGFSPIYPEIYRRGAGRLCNSDLIQQVHPELSNVSSEPVMATVELTLDGKSLGKSESLPLAPRQANQSAIIENTEGSTAQLDLHENPLKPGLHRFGLQAFVGGQLKDGVDLMVDVAPAVVQNPRVTWVGPEELEFTWEPNLEESAFRLPMKYQVWLFLRPAIELDPKEMDKAQVDKMAFFRQQGIGDAAHLGNQMLLQVVGPGVHKWKTTVKPEYIEGATFGITALDPESGFSCPDCVFVSPKQTQQALVGKWSGEARLANKPKVPPLPFSVAIRRSNEKWVVDLYDFDFKETDPECEIEVDGPKINATRTDESNANAAPTIFKFEGTVVGKKLVGFETCEEDGKVLWKKEFSLEPEGKK